MNRSISTGMWLARKLCTTVEATTVAEAVTVTKTGQPGNPIRLYHEAIGFGSDRRKLGEDVKPVHYKGENVKKNELEKCSKELRKHGKHQQALEIMEWMDFRKMEYSKSDYAIRVDITAKVKGIKATEDYVSGLPESSKDLFTYCALMRWYYKELMGEKALALFATMDELGCASSTFIFNSLMSVHMRMQNPEKVDPLVQEMKKGNIPLDERTYKTWMQSYPALEDFEALGRVLDEMKMKTHEGKKRQLVSL